ncbi:MAG: hypothetical protein AAFP84_14835 [Actinomycetota bacterium]
MQRRVAADRGGGGPSMTPRSGDRAAVAALAALLLGIAGVVVLFG